MTVRSKAAGAATLVAAPEAAVASKAAGAGKDPRTTAPGSKAAQQRQAIENIKANRKAGEAPSDEDPKPDTQPAASTGGPLAGMEAPATGGGFLLGLMVWAVARAAIGGPGQPGGAAGVKRLLLAKFLNKTTNGAK